MPATAHPWAPEPDPTHCTVTARNDTSGTDNSQGGGRQRRYDAVAHHRAGARQRATSPHGREHSPARRLRPLTRSSPRASPMGYLATELASASRPSLTPATRTILQHFDLDPLQVRQRDLHHPRSWHQRLPGGRGQHGGRHPCERRGAPLPDPMRPNNVIAPYWTDLDPSAGGAIRVATVTDDTSGTSWVVVDYDAVPDYGSTKTNTFEVWLQLGDTEGQWIDYGTLHGPNGQPLTIGAENRDGTSGVTVSAAKLAPEYFVETSPPDARRFGHVRLPGLLCSSPVPTVSTPDSPHRWSRATRSNECPSPCTSELRPSRARTSRSGRS